MPGRMKMPGGMLVLGGVAAAHVSARKAQSEMHPTVTHLQAIFTAAGTRFDVANFLYVFASAHFHSLTALPERKPWLGLLLVRPGRSSACLPQAGYAPTDACKANSNRCHESGGVRNFGRVAGLVVGNLEAQETMHGLKGFPVLRGYADAPAALRVFQLVFDSLAQALHRFGAWRILRMDQHGNLKISRREQFSDVREVRTDGVPAGGVLRVPGVGLNGPAVGIEPEMMGGLVVRETHLMIPALHHALVLSFCLGRLLRGCGFVLLHSG